MLNFRMRAMRWPTGLVSAWYARLCLSCKIQVEYSFWKTRLPAIGFTLPWQLVAAQEPGPMYFMGSGVSAEEETEAEQQKNGMARTRASQRIFNLGWILIEVKAKSSVRL